METPADPFGFHTHHVSERRRASLNGTKNTFDAFDFASEAGTSEMPIPCATKETTLSQCRTSCLTFGVKPAERQAATID